MPEEQKPKLDLSFAPSAERNLEQIEDYITDNGNADAAAKVVDQIVDRCEELATMPRSGKAREEIAPRRAFSNFWRVRNLLSHPQRQDRNS
ncbi:type II toxin-antitoxin system RelE/ParE family toxin [bacterium]|nr:type II toxin-antitoxin system RelE/ParE family toxin [bacterium]